LLFNVKEYYAWAWNEAGSEIPIPGPILLYKFEQISSEVLDDS